MCVCWLRLFERTGRARSKFSSIEVDADATEFPAAKGAVTGKKGTLEELGNAAERQKFYTVVELIQKHGFERIAWDGKCAVLFLLF